MKTKKLFLILSFISLSGCTYNQNERIQELLVSQNGTWNERRAKNIVQESRKWPTSDLFSLEMHQEGELATQKGNFPLYLLNGKTLPLEERLILAEVDELENKVEPLCEFMILETGELKIFHSNRSIRGNEIIFSKVDQIKLGRPIKYMVTSIETGYRAEAEFYPLPIESEEDRGAKISLFVTHPQSTRFEMRGSGFQPGEHLSIYHTSECQSEEIYLKADEAGRFSTELIPVEYGRLGGDAVVEIIREEGSIELNYPWGSRLEQQSMEMRQIFPIYFVYNTLDDSIEKEKIEIAVIDKLFK